MPFRLSATAVVFGVRECDTPDLSLLGIHLQTVLGARSSSVALSSWSAEDDTPCLGCDTGLFDAGGKFITCAMFRIIRFERARELLDNGLYRSRTNRFRGRDRQV
jgi:hypothetical protein